MGPPPRKANPFPIKSAQIGDFFRSSRPTTPKTGAPIRFPDPRRLIVPGAADRILVISVLTYDAARLMRLRRNLVGDIPAIRAKLRLNWESD